MADDGDKVSDIIPPGQAIESSRKLDNLLSAGIREGRRGTVAGKIDDIMSDMAEFEAETHVVLDGVRDKMLGARAKREEAAEAQHAYLDSRIGDFQKTIDAIDRMANSPLGGGGKK